MQSGVLPPKVAQQILEAAGLRFPSQVELTDKSELEHISFAFPWVMKVMGVLHKSDVGGVQVGIKTLEDARLAWDQLTQIENACGCLIQQLVTGTEVLIGANREEGFGHLVGFGLGGIYTETFKDVNFALAPLSDHEAQKMIHSLRSFSLLEGARGQLGTDIELLKDWLILIGILVNDFPQIRELDLNPVKGFGRDIYVVDARMILD